MPHAVQEAPQVASLVRFASQPLTGLPSQSAKFMPHAVHIRFIAEDPGADSNSLGAPQTLQSAHDPALFVVEKRPAAQAAQIRFVVAVGAVITN